MLKPTKVPVLVPQITQRVNQPVHITETVLKLYFKELETSLSSLAHARIQVANLGTFTIKPAVAQKRLYRRRLLLEKCNKDTERQRAIRRETEKEIDLLEKGLQMISQEKERKRSYKTPIQVLSHEKRKCSNDMEKQEPDPGRNS